jgi:hypothetical protein
MGATMTKDQKRRVHVRWEYMYHVVILPKYRKKTFMLRPSIHKFDDEFIHSRLITALGHELEAEWSEDFLRFCSLEHVTVFANANQWNKRKRGGLAAKREESRHQATLTKRIYPVDPQRLNESTHEGVKRTFHHKRVNIEQP